MLILGVDPGETTAWVKVRISEDKGAHLKAWGDWQTFDDIPVRIFGDVDIVVLEDYRVYPHKAVMHSGNRIPTAEMIGVITWLAYQADVLVVRQMASLAKQTFPNRRMKKVVTVGGLSVHVKDALRHALTWAERNNLLIVPLADEEIV